MLFNTQCGMMTEKITLKFVRLTILCFLLPLTHITRTLHKCTNEDFTKVQCAIITGNENVPVPFIFLHVVTGRDEILEVAVK